MRIASIAWRLSLALLLLVTAWQVWELRRLPRWIREEIDLQASQTRAAALTAVQDTRRDLLRRVDHFTDVSAAALAGIGADIGRRSDLRLQDLTERVDRQLTAANRSVAEAAKVRQDIQPLLAPIRNTLDVASENADLLGRCAAQDPVTGEWIGNPDCFANRLIPALKNMEHMAAAGERMAAAIEKETPATATAVRSTSQSVATIAGHFARPASWIKGVLLAGARAAGRWFGF
jgi:hypothetical protein